MRNDHVAERGGRNGWSALRRVYPLGEFKRSIRLRLTLWYVALLAVVLIAFSVGIYIFLIAHIASEIGDVERTYHHLYDRAALRASTAQGAIPASVKQGLKDVPRDSGELGQLGVYYESLLDAGPTGEYHVALSQLAALRANAQSVLLNAIPAGCHPARGNNVWCAWPVVNHRGEVQGVVAIYGSLSAVVQSEDEVRTALTLGIPLSLLIALAGGWMLASRALSPIEQLRLTAQSITATDLSRRIGMERDDELGRLARTLDEMIAGLDSAFTEQRRLTADVSHELRTPISVIQAQASLALRRTRSPQEYEVVLASIHEETERMGRIVEDLLMLARAEAGQEVLEHDPVRLDVVARWAVSQLEDAARGREVNLVSAFEPSMVVGDQGKLQQMTLNLLDNAIKYTPSGGTIRIRVDTDAGSAKLVVSDTGVGIPKDSLPHVFDRFFMTDRSRSEGGSGLGLSIVHWIVEAHMGTVFVESSEGVGSTFTVSIPMHNDDGGARSPSVRTSAPRTRRLRSVTARPPDRES
jgi:two-component system OmpR family sensor kinase